MWLVKSMVSSHVKISSAIKFPMIVLERQNGAFPDGIQGFKKKVWRGNF